MAHKLIKDIDEETWRRFIAYCKLKDMKVGDQLGLILNNFLRIKLKRLLK